MACTVALVTKPELLIHPTGIDIQFTETDYVTDEGDQAVVVAVQVKGRWATDVAVFVTPLDYDELRSSRAPLPPDFPEVPASEPWSPNRANGVVTCKV